MFQKIVYTILEKRHFWRYATFSEIAELYASRTLRVIAMNIVSGFTSVYLYENGYSLAFIACFWLAFYVIKVPTTYLSGFFVARFGPKHGIFISNLLYVPAMVSLALMSILGVTSIVFWGLFMAFSASLYHLSYIIDFSKVKNVEHAGKELALMNILEKVSIGISPIIGGVIALWFGLEIVIWVAAALFAVAALPLLKTMEPTRLHQKIEYEGFPWRLTWRSMVAQVGVGFDYVTTGVIWSMFIVIVIFPGAGWDIYVKLGFMSSATIIAAIVASYTYGKLIDRSKGGFLLKASVIANSAVHLFRPFASNPAMIVGTNIANEAATMGYTMSFMRGVFDTADLSGHRILYLTLCDIIADIGAAIACLILLLLIGLMGDMIALHLFFVFAAGFVLLIGVAGFQLYRK